AEFFNAKKCLRRPTANRAEPGRFTKDFFGPTATRAPVVAVGKILLEIEPARTNEFIVESIAARHKNRRTNRTAPNDLQRFCVFFGEI
ncbi:MAG: hypothetical protein RMM53_02990, partial [Bacteroidia bacterium]|nr:hypothetical protein [Bacteroidia bacterium]